MKPNAPVLVAALGLSACVAIPTQPEIQQASAAGGDFSLLSCNELANAEGAVRQRIAQPSEAGVYTFGVYTPDGAPVAERTDILNANAEALGTLRERRDCAPKPAARPTAATVVEAEPATAAPAPAPAPAATAKKARSSNGDAAATPRRGKFLQVATFSSAANRDATIRALQARGVAARAEPLRRGGREMHRILIGPLRSFAELTRADKAAAELGLTDGFFVDG